MKYKNDIRILLPATLSILLVTALIGYNIVSGSGPAPYQSLGYQWWTLGSSVYRNPVVPLAYKGAYTGALNVKWSYTMYNTETGIGFSVSSNPLLVDLDDDGVQEVIFTDDAGEFFVLSGQDGSRILRTGVGAAPFSTPAILDVDADGSYELFVTTKYGTLRSYRINTATWTLALLWETPPMGQMLSSSPLVYDVDGDGSYEVMITAPSGFYVFDATTGNPVSKVEKGLLVLGASPLIVGDIDGDNVSEIAVSDAYGLLCMIDPVQGIVEWEIELQAQIDGFILHTPVISDTDGDSMSEIIVPVGREVFDWIPGTNSDQTSTGLQAAKRGVSGGLVIVDAATGTVEAVISDPSKPLFAWFSQPAIAAWDVDGDSIAEIFVGSGDGWLYRVEYSGGAYTLTSISQLDTSWPSFVDSDAPPIASSILLLDVDQDGLHEIAALSTDDRPGGNILDYSLYILDDDMTVSGQITLTYLDVGAGTSTTWIFSWPSVAAGDVDGDGVMEIVVVTYQGVTCIDW